MNVPSELRDQTVFERMRLSTGGTGLRVVYSNRYGARPLKIGAASVRLDGQPAIHQVLFGGSATVEIPPGADAVSDPVSVVVPPLTGVWAATWFPVATPVTTFHWGGQQTARLQAGDHTRATPSTAARTVTGRMFVSSILVSAPARPVVVALGDSITDGNGSTPDRDRRWPDQLADRLAPAGVAVLNAGISGGRLLTDGKGRSRTGAPGRRRAGTAGCEDGRDPDRHQRHRLAGRPVRPDSAADGAGAYGGGVQTADRALA